MKLILTLALTLGVLHCYAQETISTDSIASQSKVEKDPFRAYFGIETGLTWIGNEASDEHYIGKTGGAFAIEGGCLIYDVFDIYLSGGAAFPKDKDGFSQQVQSVTGGRVTDAESELEVVSWDFAAGPRTPYFKLSEKSESVFKAISFFGRYGASTVKGNRTIPNCTDCYDETLSMNNGSFFDLGADLTFFNATKYRSHLLFTYRDYRKSAGLDKELKLTLRFSFL